MKIWYMTKRKISERTNKVSNWWNSMDNELARDVALILLGFSMIVGLGVPVVLTYFAVGIFILGTAYVDKRARYISKKYDEIDQELRKMLDR